MVIKDIIPHSNKFESKEEFIDAMALEAFKREARNVGNSIAHKMIKCQNCGHIGEDVFIYKEWIGGKGYEDIAQCRNKRECWARAEGK